MRKPKTRMSVCAVPDSSTPEASSTHEKPTSATAARMEESPSCHLRPIFSTSRAETTTPTMPTAVI